MMAVSISASVLFPSVLYGYNAALLFLTKLAKGQESRFRFFVED